MDKTKYKKQDCIELLLEKQEQLNNSGEDRYPCRADFSDAEVTAIKAFLGPWPRALEAAKLKPPREDDRKRLNIEKRIRAKRRRTENKIQEEKNKSTDCEDSSDQTIN